MDSHKNFAYSTVATAPSPATSGTSLVVAAGQGALFPTVPFNAVVWAAAANPLTTNAEIVRVTGISTDTLTIVRAQETDFGGPSARTIVVGDQIMAAITARTLTDAEDNFFNLRYIQDVIHTNKWTGQGVASGAGASLDIASDIGSLALDSGNEDASYVKFTANPAGTIDWTKAYKWRMVQNAGTVGHTASIIKFGMRDFTSADTTKHIGFRKNSSGVWLATNANGTTETSTDITASVTVNQMNVWDFVFRPGVDIKFYLNSVLLATHTTNLPSSGTDANALYLYLANNTGYSSFNEPTMVVSTCAVRRAI